MTTRPFVSKYEAAALACEAEAERYDALAQGARTAITQEQLRNRATSLRFSARVLRACVPRPTSSENAIPGSSLPWISVRRRHERRPVAVPVLRQ